MCDLCISVICDIRYYIHLFQNMYPRCEEHQQEAGMVSAQDSTAINCSVDKGTMLLAGVAAFKRETMR